MTVHSFARSKLPRQNMMHDVRIFSRVLVLGNSMRIDKRQSIQLCPPLTAEPRVRNVHYVTKVRVRTCANLYGGLGQSSGGGFNPMKLTRFHKMRGTFCIETCIKFV